MLAVVVSAFLIVPAVLDLYVSVEGRIWFILILIQIFLHRLTTLHTQVTMA